MQQQLDQVILVDEQDHEVGVMDKIEAHRGQGKLHRASSVFLFNDQNQLMIQQRSRKKIVGAGQWANTCCGNVWPNESYRACADRRLSFELGLTNIQLKEIYVFRYHVKCNEAFSENEMDHIFVGRFNGQPAPNPDEVQATKWIDFKNIKTQSLDFAPWFGMMLNDQKLHSLLDSFLKN